MIESHSPRRTLRRRLAVIGAIAIASIGASLIWFGRAEAQERSQTIRVEAAPFFLEGRLVGCSINYRVRVRDDMFRGGQFSVAIGSLNILMGDLTLVAGLKIAVSPSADGEAPRQAPSMAYLISDLETNVDDYVQEVEADGEGFASFVFIVGDPTLNAVVDAGFGSFGMGYTMGDSSGVQPFRVDVPDETAQEFSRCFETLLQNGIDQASGA